jgi:hypothetical protein
VSDLVIEELQGAKACKEVISPCACVCFACLLSLRFSLVVARERERARERKQTKHEPGVHLLPGERPRQ